MNPLIAFCGLDCAHCDARTATMPRTTLRYAIEQLPENERIYWMNKKNLQQNP